MMCRRKREQRALSAVLRQHSLMADVWSAMIPLRASSAMRQRARMASAMTLFFYVPEKGKYMAELSSEEKNAISHRGKALRKMKEMLKKETVSL